MSKSNEPGTQSNPEQERVMNSDGVATSHADFSLPVPSHPGEPSPAQPPSVPIEQEPDALHQNSAGRSDAGHSVSGKNGVNGVHKHATQDGAHAALQRATDEAASEEHGIETPEIESPELELSKVELSEAEIPGVEVSGVEESPSAHEAVEASPTAGLSTPRSAVKIKGRPGGVSLELGDGEWDELMLLLEERLHAAEGFFRGGRVLLEVGARTLVEDQLRQVRGLLETHEMQLAVVRATAERTLLAAAEVGVSTTHEDTYDALHVPEPPLLVEDGPPNAYTPSTYAPPPEIVSSRPNHFVYRGSLRSGQVLRKTESIVVIGDVNPGAQVVSGGDVMVWGRLRGIAHAGAEGNLRAVVAAIDFVPTQLRIANLTAIAPERAKPRRGGLFFWKKEPERGPEIARVIDGRIVVEPWDEGKPNGLGMWRKK